MPWRLRRRLDEEYEELRFKRQKPLLRYRDRLLREQEERERQFFDEERDDLERLELELEREEKQRVPQPPFEDLQLDEFFQIQTPEEPSNNAPGTVPLTMQSNTRNLNVSSIDVQPDDDKEPRGCSPKVTRFRALSVILAMILLPPKAMAAYRGDNVASGTLEWLNGLIGMGLIILGYWETVPRAWCYWFFDEDLVEAAKVRLRARYRRANDIEMARAS